jgi:hypothetical protein
VQILNTLPKIDLMLDNGAVLSLTPDQVGAALPLGPRSAGAGAWSSRHATLPHGHHHRPKMDNCSTHFAVKHEPLLDPLSPLLPSPPQYTTEFKADGIAVPLRALKIARGPRFVFGQTVLNHMYIVSIV